MPVGERKQVSTPGRQAPPRPFNPAPATDPDALEIVTPFEPGIPEPAPDQPKVAGYWRDMADAPTNRPIFISADIAADPEGTLCYWRRSRTKTRPGIGWTVTQYWASVLTHRRLEPEGVAWREAAGGAALAAAIEAEAEAAQ